MKNTTLEEKEYLEWLGTMYFETDEELEDYYKRLDKISSKEKK